MISLSVIPPGLSPDRDSGADIFGSCGADRLPDSLDDNAHITCGGIEWIDIFIDHDHHLHPRPCGVVIARNYRAGKAAVAFLVEMMWQAVELYGVLPPALPEIRLSAVDTVARRSPAPSRSISVHGIPK